MKKAKKITCITLVVVLMLSFLSGCDMYNNFILDMQKKELTKDFKKALEKQVPTEKQFSYTSEHTAVKQENRYDYNSLNSSEKEVYKRIDTAVKNYWNLVDISDIEAETNSFYKVCTYYTEQNPDAFWIDTFSVFSTEDKNIGILISYCTTVGSDIFKENSFELLKVVARNDLDDIRGKFVEETNKILNEVDVDDDDLKKEIYIYDYFVNNITYDDSLKDSILANEKTNSLSKHSYGALVNKTTVCSGYSYAFAHIMLQLGIDCVQVYGKSQNLDHQWNMVLIDDSFYHVDSTWGSKNETDKKDITAYNYLNLTDSEIARDHIITGIRSENNEVIEGPKTPKAEVNIYAFSKFFAVDANNLNDLTPLANSKLYNLEGINLVFNKPIVDINISKYMTDNFDTLQKNYKTIYKKKLSGEYFYSVDSMYCYLADE